MKKSKCYLLMVCLLAFGVIGACSKKDDVTEEESEAVDDSSDDSGDDAETSTPVAGTADNGLTHEAESDYVWDASSIVEIELKGSSIGVSSEAVTVDGIVATIAKAGNYRVTGTLSDGQLVVNTDEEGLVRIVLNGVTIASSTSAPIFVKKAQKVIVVLGDGTQNSLSDGASYVFASADESEPDAALFSKSNLTIYGNGALTVTGNYSDGIASKDGLILKAANVNVTALDDGIRGKDYLVVASGEVTVTAQGDGLRSTNDQDASLGFVDIQGGTVKVTSAKDAIDCEGNYTMSGGEVTLEVGSATATTGAAKGIKSARLMNFKGGSVTVTLPGNVYLEASGSGYDPAYATGIKGGVDVSIDGSRIKITGTGKGGKGISAAGNLVIHSGSVEISESGAGATYKNSTGTTDAYSAVCLTAKGDVGLLGGTLVLTASGSGGKGVNAGGKLTIGQSGNGPDLTVTTTGAKFVVSGSDYSHPKALKSDGEMTVNGGTMRVSSTDDGMSSATSITMNDGEVTIVKSVEGIESKIITMNGGNVSVVASNDGVNATMGTVSGGTESNDGSCFYMKGGCMTLNVASGDALDSNGNVQVSGGTLVMHGPASQPEEALDYNGTFTLTGGFVIASSPTSGMHGAKTPGGSTSQYNVTLTASSGVSAGNIFRVQDASGTDVVTFEPARTARVFFLTSPALQRNVSYSVYTGGSCTGTLKDGLYSGGTYSGGASKKTFSLSTSAYNTAVSF